MEKIRIGSSRVLNSTEAELSGGESIEHELVTALRLLLKEARKGGAVTLADVETLTLTVRKADDLFGPGSVRVDFRMTKEVDQ